ncbi:MAG: glycosyl hydrolase family 8 [Acidobacteriota bacterium]|nr:glycosyl hydrolase family 8 [Acidobacteriota bacterium]
MIPTDSRRRFSGSHLKPHSRSKPAWLAVLGALLLLGVAQGCTPEAPPEEPAVAAVTEEPLEEGGEEVSEVDEWSLYRQRFITPEGRTIDTANRSITHSEAQGFALLLAAAYDDRETFDRLWTWTREHLQVREDQLLAWRWSPENGVDDPNNATDGDLLVTWALLRAWRRWDETEYRDAGLRIAEDLRSTVVHPSPHGPVLLPGQHGFNHPGELTVNLSYWVFPALAVLEVEAPAPEWAEVRETGLALLGPSCFGQWQLPPDWLRVEPELAVAPGFDPLFGYNAVRIPLYLVWAGLETEERLRPYLDFWEHFRGARFLSAWTDLTDDSIGSYDAGQGIHGIVALTRAAAGREPGRSARIAAAPLDPEEHYYSASLLLLSRLAMEERP